MVLSSTSPAFEYAALSVTTREGQAELPLPPAMVLFGTALAGLAALGRRRRKGAVVRS